MIFLFQNCSKQTFASGDMCDSPDCDYSGYILHRQEEIMTTASPRGLKGH